MQEIFRVAVVAERDYEALRQLIEDAPTTYAEWIELSRQRAKDESLRGFAIRNVNVDPRQFAAFCRSRGEATDFVALGRFLAEIDRDRKY